MELFRYESDRLEFTKLAATKLDEDPTKWPRQVLVELFKQVPSITDYSPQVVFHQIDRERGTGFGAVIVSADTNTAITTSVPLTAAPKAIIPVFVRDYELAPLDVLLAKGGKYYPLNPDRLREVLFRPETFDLLSDEFANKGLYDLLYPPGRYDNSYGSGIGFGGGGGGISRMIGPGMKFAAAEYPILSSMAPTLLDPDVRRLESALKESPALEKAASTNRAFLGALSVIADVSPVKTAEDHIRAALWTSPVDVVQLGYYPSKDAYWVKTASRRAYVDNVQLVNRGTAIKLAGAEVVEQVDTSGPVTLAAQEAQAPVQVTGGDEWAEISEPGVYRVRTMEGKDLVGWALPSMISAEGTETPMVLFTNGSEFSIQESILGVKSSDRVDLPAARAKPGMTGLFYVPGRRLVTTELLVIQGSQEAEDGAKVWLATTVTGEDVLVRMVEGVKNVLVTGGEYIVPPTTLFLAVDSEKHVDLASAPSDLEKTAAYLGAPKAWVQKIEDTYHLSFEGAPKLAACTKSQLGREDFVFTLCLGGYGADTAHKIAHAASGIRQAIPINDIRPVEDIVRDGREEGQKLSSKILNFRQYLWKEAAMLPDSTSIDAVLGLGFINSENVRSLISHVPHLEAAMSRLGGLLVSARLGVSEVPEAATARAMRAIDEVLRGLFALGFRQTEGT